MLDEMDRLRNNLRLVELLAHYARLGEADREIWQDRLMQMEGVESSELAKLHGELIAHRWVDQNTGIVPVARAGEVPGCYRITAQGQKALRLAQGLEREEDATTPQVPEKPVLKFPKKKRKAASEPAPETPPVAA